MAQESFFHILVDELTRSIRQEIKQQMRSETTASSTSNFSQASQNQIFQALNLDLKPKFFSGQKNGYFAKTNSVRKPLIKLLEKRPRQPMNDLELKAFDLFKVAGANLDDGFNERELKKEFRKLAHLCHPDRANLGNANHLFTELRAAYELLIRFLQN